MKTFLFLHREQLSELYISLSKNIGEKLNLVHVAFGDKEARLLELAGITDYYNYTQLTSQLFNSAHLDNKLLEQIDSLFIVNTDKRFNLNAALQSDRGFSLLSYEQALLSAQVHYLAWESIFDKHKIDFLLHEPCSLFFNHIAALFCKSQGGRYLWFSDGICVKEGFHYLVHDGDAYENIELKTYFEYYKNNTDQIDIKRCQEFTDNYRKNYDVFFGGLISVNKSKFNLYYSNLRELLVKTIKKNEYDVLKNNIDYWVSSQRPNRERLRNALNYKEVQFESLPETIEPYYYYSIHLEPEATVLYLGDGIYANQIKLIENIAASLPSGVYLYVKDHPHEYAYRSAEDYKRLNAIPNIRLLEQSIPGKLVIKNAIGVFSINGTAGFEGLMLGKQVYCFGWSYYCYHPRVNYIRDIRNLRDVIYQNENLSYKDDSEFYAYIQAYLDACHAGYTCYFSGLASTNCEDPDMNAKKIVDDLLKYSERF